VFQFTETSSGNTIGAHNATYDYTVTYGTGYTFTAKGIFHGQTLLKSGETFVWTEHFSDTQNVPGLGTCTYAFEYVYANGTVRHENSSFTCA
jgi:hypothetical protein